MIFVAEKLTRPLLGRLYMQSVLKVQQENAPNVDEWYRKQQEGMITLFGYTFKNCATHALCIKQPSNLHFQNRQKLRQKGRVSIQCFSSLPDQNYLFLWETT
jgi:hypothetical protein